jgi:ubiquinone/menaquinone biosynthesis C-methylase UbiE
MISLNQTVLSKKFLTNHIRSNSSVLEIGCGNGDVAIQCAKKGANVTAIDISENMIENAKQNAKKNNVEGIKFFQKDVNKLEIDGKFDVIILCYFFNIFPDEKSVGMVIEKVKPYLKSNGYILIADELKPNNLVLSSLVNFSRIPVFIFFRIKTGMMHHKIHDLKKILEKSNFQILEEKRFLFQYCSVIVAKV